MSRLQSELQRLYLKPAGAGPDEARAMVLALSGPPEWAELSAVWRGVQDELGLPAPGIAVSGTDGLQLWFSLAEPVGAARAAVFLENLRSRFLPDVAPARVRLVPSNAGAHDLPSVPAQHEASGNWSAFVAPGLAPVFGDSPWLDIPPGIDGQADLLSKLDGIAPAAFALAEQRLAPSAHDPAAPEATPVRAGRVDPRRFLQQVLDDDAAPLALRVEAAKALLGRGP